MCEFTPDEELIPRLPLPLPLAATTTPTGDTDHMTGRRGFEHAPAWT
jgi:hypothetical protein